MTGGPGGDQQSCRRRRGGVTWRRAFGYWPCGWGSPTRRTPRRIPKGYRPGRSWTRRRYGGPSDSRGDVAPKALPGVTFGPVGPLGVPQRSEHDSEDAGPRNAARRAHAIRGGRAASPARAEPASRPQAARPDLPGARAAARPARRGAAGRGGGHRVPARLSPTRRDPLVIVLNTTVGVVQEVRADRAIAALRPHRRARTPGWSATAPTP